MMKKQNAKQKAYADRRMARAQTRMALWFLGSLVFTFAIVAMVSLVGSEPLSFLDALGASGGGVVMGSMAAIGDIDSVSDQYTAGKQIAYKVWLIDVKQIDEDQTYPSPNTNREVGTIPLLSGEYMHYFEAIDDTLKDGSTGEKGDITTEVTNTFSFTMGGDTAKLYDFLEQHSGDRFIVIFQKCSTGEYFVTGTRCKPMVLKSWTRKRDNESTSVDFTFQNTSFKQPYKYVGSITKADPETIAAGATELAIAAGKDQYQLSDHSESVALATVSGITSSRYGDTIEVLGSGGSFPATIADNSVFVLIDAATWTANGGSRISFLIVDDETLVEIAGTRVQT